MIVICKSSHYFYFLKHPTLKNILGFTDFEVFVKFIIINIKNRGPNLKID